MLGNKKVIGVCVTKIHDATRSDYLNRLHHLALKSDCKLLIFNSFADFFNNDSFDEGAKSVYEVMNYDILDAVLIFHSGFHNKAVADGIIGKARERGVPVILVNGEDGCCHSITADYNDAFRSVMSHVIRDHGVTDTFFIAGNRENDRESPIRIQCYKEALEENGLPFEESRLDYGGYWEDPTKQIIYRLAGEGRKPPRAIFCANDYMAFAACEELKRCGYSVPEDVIVTGFDGVPEAEHYSPQLTTCREDLEELAELSLKAVEDALRDNTEIHRYCHKFIPRLSESCGCERLTQSAFRDIAGELYRTIHEMEVHEDFEFAWIDHMLEITDINSLFHTLSGCMLENSYACLNSDFLASIMELSREKGDELFSEELVVIPSQYSKNESVGTGRLRLADMIPNLNGWAEDNTSYVISSIYVGGEVCGYYAARTDNIMYSKHKLKRVLKTINVAFNVAINYFKQANMRVSMERAALTSSVTGLPNFKGAVKWFEGFSNSAESHGKPLSVSVYGLPKYTYIYENYGIEDAEDALRFVAEALKIANPSDCLVAHIAEDEFVIVNYYGDSNAIGDTINKATSVFFSLIEGYNTSSGKKYFVEVNCGCTVVDPGWNGSLESYIKFANSEMYMNRLKSGIGIVEKEQTAPKEQYKAFHLLIEKNLFHYHFQPIVSAKNGEIIAYEALMRTDASIGMNPLEVLDAAKAYNRLYDIERATVFNIMERYVSERESFGDRMVFINTIPGHFLNEEDIALVSEKYGGFMDRFVFELTEQGTVSDEELNSIKLLSGRDDNGLIAIDDYGTGYSNIVNVMRYAPQVIKIDRFLIADIHKNRNKQMFVSSTIDFARLNNIEVLAEGVETSNELRMVIDLGVDYIQGYYTARPAPQPIPAISEEVRTEIIQANPLVGQEKPVAKRPK